MPYQTPGVYRIDVIPTPPLELWTGVPAFLGYTTQLRSKPILLSLWTQFAEQFGDPLPGSYLGAAVRGFFENGGVHCYVVHLAEKDGDGHGILPLTSLQQGLKLLAPLTDFDLICAPDIMRSDSAANINKDDVAIMQKELLEYCDRRGDCFAILDCLPNADIDQVVQQRQKLNTMNGALYYPWIKVQTPSMPQGALMPPCGHIAGVYARTDQRTGVHKAPANEALEGVLDLEREIDDLTQGQLNPQSVDCLRAFPGRGIRVWGARTLSNNSAWLYINVRRLFLTASRWIERNMSAMIFEQNDPSLWTRIERELTAYLNGLFQRGALKGSKPQEAFYVKCDAETNPSEVREEGRVVTEIGLAPAVPNEFVIVRIVHGASGVTISGPDLAPDKP